MNEGDWICSDPNCGNINFARRLSCYRCNKERPDGVKALQKKLGTEIGKSAAEKSRGLFNADDWQCNKCANVNWARRQTCNVCNAPKFGEVEARTGYGGGYNERGVVEYRRREPSSEDEYDEFGRKKRKRRDEDSENKVGITEGPVNKKLPPTKLQMEFKLDYVKPPSPSYMPQVITKDSDTIQGSLSDVSVCDIPVNKTVFMKYQEQSQSNNLVEDNKLPFYETNHQPRKRLSSTGDKEHTASSGYETSSKKSKHDNIPPIAKTYSNPVMENRVSSTNNDFLYKGSAQTLCEDLPISYTIEEKVKAAAFVIVYNNCKISSEKFEAIFDKQAPDYKTLFMWRQRLLTKGCIADDHIDSVKKSTTTQSVSSKLTTNNDIKEKPKVVQKIPNPDEIPIISDSDDYEVDAPRDKKSLAHQRSSSNETLILRMDSESKPAGGSLSVADDQESHTRSHSLSTHCRTRSSSRDSEDSDYPHSECEVKTKPKKPRSTLGNMSNTPKQSVNDSDSSLSYNSEDEDFLSRSFGTGKKVRRKIKRRPVPAKVNTYQSNDVQPLKGYCTLNSSAQSPLVTGNIYTSNLRNMAVKPRNRENNIVDVDGCSSEYVPTKSGATAKKNYQEFKNNVKKKGFWAKGNSSSFIKAKPHSQTTTPQNTNSSVTYNVETYPSQNQGYVSGNQPVIQNREEFGSSNIENFGSTKDYSMYNNQSQTCTITTQNTINYKDEVLDRPAATTTSFYTKVPEKNTTTNVYNKPAQDAICVQKRTTDTLYVQTSENTSDVFDKCLQNSMLPNPSEKSLHNFKTTQKTIFSANTQDRIQGFDKTLQNVCITQETTSNVFDKLLSSSPASFHHTANIFEHGVKTSSFGKITENASSIFNIVQSNSASKNRSITDIFNLQEQRPEKNDDINQSNNAKKRYETRWDEDDDALYSTDTPESSMNVSVQPHNNLKSFNSEIPRASVDSECKMDNIYNKSKKINIREKCENFLNLFEDIQRNKEMSMISNKPISHNITFIKHNVKQNLTQNLIHDNSNRLIVGSPDPIPADLSNEIKSMSEEIQNDLPESVNPSKRVQILESITFPANTMQSYGQDNVQKDQTPSPSKNMYFTQESNLQECSAEQSGNKSQTGSPPFNNTNRLLDTSTSSIELNKSEEAPQNAPQVDISNLLTGINTNVLFMALQNLQQFNQNSSSTQNVQDNENQGQNVETINLTNDEEWERETNRDGSIERQLAEMDGNTGDTPFLSDIFDPGPVILPPNVAKKLNLNLHKPDEKNENHLSHLNENAPVIGNFKSFALPKPILLNRLKLTVKAPERNCKKSAEDKKSKRKKKEKGGTSQQGEEGKEEDEEESGDEADLSKYDLWGSDGEQGTSSKHDGAEKTQEGDGTKVASGDSGDKNGKSPSGDSKSSKKRSRSSSSSSTSSSSSSSSYSSDVPPKNKFDDFNLNSERESVHNSPKGRKSRSRSPQARLRSTNPPPPRRKSRDSRSAGESSVSRNSRDKEKSRDRERRDRSRGAVDDRKQRRYSRDGKSYSGRDRHR